MLLYLRDYFDQRLFVLSLLEKDILYFGFLTDFDPI
jgi:hypothetical protein